MCVRLSMLVLLALGVRVAVAADCIECHQSRHAEVVASFAASAHHEADVDCVACHGAEHRDETDVDEARTPDAGTCAACHASRLEEYQAGKHGAAWIAMRTFDAGHGSPGAEAEDPQACSTCHVIGTKPLAEIRSIPRNSTQRGRTSCDACHERHEFSVDQAKSPDACASCHRGVGHAQAEMFETSTHGRLHRDPARASTAAPAPSCQACHTPDGRHEVRTAWGFYGVRWPIDAIAAVDTQWAEDQRSILFALGMFDAAEQPTWRFTAAQVLDMFRMDDDAFVRERERMVDACSACHDRDLATAELRAGDGFLREVDRLMAAAIETVRALYDDGVLVHGANDGTARPDLFAIGPTSAPIEVVLGRMFFEHRANAFMGRFHGSEEYAERRGSRAMADDLRRIEAIASRLRESR